MEQQRALLRSAVSASLIGDLPDHHLMAGHHRSGFREPRLSQSTIACSSCLHCQPHRVQIFGVVLHRHGRPARRHHWRLPRSHGQRACQLSTHLGEALAETQHVWRHMRDGIELPAPQADDSWHRATRTQTLVDGDGDDGQPHTRQRRHVQKVITSRVGRDSLKPSCKRTSVPGAGFRRSHTVVGGGHRLPRGSSTTGGWVTFSVVPSRALRDPPFEKTRRTTFPVPGAVLSQTMTVTL